MAESSGQEDPRVLLLETKLYAPKWRQGLVARPRLIARLQPEHKRKLTLVSAPAGFGKTTLLSEWLAAAHAQELPVAWISLDPADNDPVFFWAYFIKALQSVQPGIGEAALSMLRSPQQPQIETVLTSLINEIDSIEMNFAVIFDDYHVIEAQSVHGAFSFFLDHLPPQMQLVIASRSDPPIRLARLRGQGELTELRASDLRFTPGETGAFLNETMGLGLPTAGVAALEARTEGWIAGLQLAALSLQARDDAGDFITTFAGDDRYILDYLVEEVLQRQPDSVRAFLLQTAFLDRLNGALCDAVTGREDGDELLQSLERGNLFVVPLDDKRRWYRYHHLFADVLRALAMAEQSDRANELHRRAAAWFEKRGMAAEAIQHARAAEDHESVARLVAANFDAFERIGRYASMSGWLASLPEEMFRQRPRLAYIRAAVAVAFDDNNQAARKFAALAEDAIRTLEERGGFDAEDDTDGTVIGSGGLDVLKGEMLAMKIFLSARKLSQEEVAAIVARALELLPPSKQRLRLLLEMFGTGIQIDQKLSKATLEKSDRSVVQARRAKNPSLVVGALSQQGAAYVGMGKLAEGRRAFEDALQTGRKISGEASWMMCSPHTALAEIFLELANYERATHHIVRTLEFVRSAPTRSPVLYARASAAKVLLATGDTPGALENLMAAETFVRGSSDSRYSSFLSSVQLEIHCGTGDINAAADIERERGLTPDIAAAQNRERELIAYARFLVARGNNRDALQVLSNVLPGIRSGGRVQREIQALVLQCVAFESSGEHEKALAALGKATRLGEPGRFAHTFTSAGPVMFELLQPLAKAAGSRKPDGSRAVESGSPAYIAFLLRKMRREPAPASAASAPEQGSLVAPLTAREVEILSLIASGLRNQEIADRLYISLHTVKRHIANAYGKLGVLHRAEAIVRVNELKLL